MQARRPGRDDRHVRELHLAAASSAAGRRRVHVLGPRDRHRRQRRPDARHARRSRSTPPRRTRRSPAARPARRTSTAPTFDVHLERGGLDVRVPARRPRRRGRHVRGLHLAAHPRLARRRPYTFLVRATDAAGNVDATPASRSFTVDTTAPDTTITGGPTGTTNGTTPSFTFTATEAGLDVRVQARHARRGAGTYAACTSPQRLHATRRRRLHVLGPRDRRRRQRRRRRPATRTFTVDTAAPDTTITRGPTGTTNVASPSFAFTSRGRLDVRVQARRPGATTGTYAACTSPRAYAALADGAYTFSVRATDAAGNVDADARDADVHGRHGRAGHDDHRGPTGADERRRAVVRVHLTEAGSTFECKLDGRRDDRHLRDLHVAAGLRARSPTARTRSRSARPTPAGNVDATPATRTFTVDTAAPDTTIDGGPSGTTSVDDAAFTFSLDEAGVDVRVQARRPGAAPARTRLHVAAGLHRARRRRVHVLGPRDATPPATSTRRPRRGRSRSTRPRRTRRSPAARRGTTNVDVAVVRVHLDRGGRDVRVQARRPRRDTGTYAAARRRGRSARSPTARTRSRSARPTRPATSTRRRRRGRSRSTRPRRTRRSPAARPARRRARRRRSRSPRPRPGSTFECKLDTPARRRHLRGVHVAAGVHDDRDGAYTFSVRATDAAGNVDATPATRTFTVEAVAPDADADRDADRDARPRRRRPRRPPRVFRLT